MTSNVTFAPRISLSLVTAVAFASVAAAVAADLHQIVEVEGGYFFGGSRDGKWITAKAAAESTGDRTEYRVYGLTEELKKTTGSKPKSVDEPCPDTYGVELKPKPKNGVIALAAPWNALPRKPRVLDPTQEVYVTAARDFLRTRAIKQPTVKITRILRVDLEGDGEEEVLLSATHYKENSDGMPSSAPAGSYSFVLLRRIVAGKLQTQLVAGEFYPKATNFSAPNNYEISAVLDLNGDGKLEVVVESAYYEGGATTIYRCTPTKLVPVLSVECGA